jgi:hypothetical protein
MQAKLEGNKLSLNLANFFTNSKNKIFKIKK